MAQYEFTGKAPHETGFGEVFHERIVPVLERHEAIRKEYRKKALMGMGGTGTAGLGGIGAGASYESEIGLVAGGAGIIGTWGVKAYFESKWKGGLGSEVLPILCGFLGEMTYGSQKIDVGTFERIGLVPNFNQSSLEDPVTGTHDGWDWALTEAVLKNRTRDSKGRTRTRTVFRGLLFRIAINGPAPLIFFGRDRGGALNWLSETFSSSRRNLEKIEVGDAAFESVYETYTSDPGAAMTFIDERLTAGLMEVAREEGGRRYVSCALEGDWLYLALPRKGDFLGLGSLFSSLTGVEGDLHEALDDLCLPRRVIDRLRGV